MRRNLVTVIVALVAATFFSIQVARSATITTWNLAGGGSWGTAANWNPATVPNAVDDSATFNNAATGSNPAQTANRTVTLDGSKTVGTLVFNNTAAAANTFTNTVSTGTGGPLVFD